MEKSRENAAQAAKTNGYPKRARLFSPDGHASKDIITVVDDISTERFVRAHARRIGWRCSIRKVKQQPAAIPVTTNRTWRKPAAIAGRPRLPLGGAFDLALTPYRRKGGER